MNFPIVSARARLCALACVFAMPAFAAGPSPAFKVADAQIKALGIQLAPLSAQAQGVRASYPAQVMAAPEAEQIVSAPLPAMVAQVLVQPFQTVKAGAPLLRLASPELGQWQLQAVQAQSRLQLARTQAQREQQLFEEGIIAQRRLQEAQAALAEAQATQQQATAALRLAGMGQGAISALLKSGQAEGSVLLAAPRAGTVGALALRPGQRVEAGTALLSISSGSAQVLDIQLPASVAAAWTAGTRVLVSGRTATARVQGMAPSVTPGSQSLMLRAVVEGSGLRAGEMVQVELPVGASKDGWDLPLAAVAHDGGQAYVFVRTRDGFEARAVGVKASGGQRVQVQGPLKEGEQVAISGVVALKGAWLSAKGE
ncbi:efflux RND transporter periplasmic adaptor subunit [Massilia sp. TS11]|uniref:efflux RND transporter periplasmic adaptor subunit n=1 Tax=Massilia sp. TS11 TaxID=2908003 RepID=UPI001EDC3552|nr:efflux RND transporter periplasmic adaptor subunit [Massilia sp. TS11]MCG2585634.1 efflux RND transporter periplasmic adaptor subunit [Massilia sp. TS11]